MLIRSSSTAGITLVPSSLLRMLLNALVSFHRHSLQPPSGPLLAGLCHVEFHGGLRTIKLVCRFSRFRERVSPIAHSRMVTSVLCTLRSSRIRCWLHWKNSQPKKNFSRLPDLSCPSHWGFSWAMFLSGCRGPLHALESADYSLFVCRDDTPHHRCLVANMAWGPVASHSLMPTIWGSSRTSHCVCTKKPVPRGVPMFSVMKFPQPMRILQWRRTNGWRAFDQSRGRSLRAAA